MVNIYLVLYNFSSGFIMPKTSQKCKFRGTPAWKKKETNGGLVVKSQLRPQNQPSMVALAVKRDYSEEELIPRKTTASEQKLGSGSSTASHYEENAYSYTFETLWK